VNGRAAGLFLAGAVGFGGGRTDRQAGASTVGDAGDSVRVGRNDVSVFRPWDSTWWTWHLVRVAAYVIALTYISRGYVRMVGETRKTLVEATRSARRLSAEYALTRVLAESATIKDATQGVLRVVGETLDWEIGMFWGLEQQDNVLRFIDLWHAPDVKAAEFIEDSKDRTFKRGEGLVGRVWDTGKPIWIPDVCADPRFRRAQMAARSGLHGAFAFPVSKGERLYGVIDCFSRTSRDPIVMSSRWWRISGSKSACSSTANGRKRSFGTPKPVSSRSSGSAKWHGVGRHRARPEKYADAHLGRRRVARRGTERMFCHIAGACIDGHQAHAREDP
jgi:hypothetical protein